MSNLEIGIAAASLATIVDYFTEDKTVLKTLPSKKNRESNRTFQMIFRQEEMRTANPLPAGASKGRVLATIFRFGIQLNSILVVVIKQACNSSRRCNSQQS